MQIVGNTAASTRVFDGERGHTTIKSYGLDGLVVGSDNELIRLMALIGNRSKKRYPHPDDVFLDDFTVSGAIRRLVGLVHLIDVRSEDPNGFKLETYGARAAFGRGLDFSERRVIDIPSGSIRDMAVESYLLAKVHGAPIVSEISAEDTGFTSSYKRLILPMSDDSRDVTHLLVAILRHSFQVQ